LPVLLATMAILYLPIAHHGNNLQSNYFHHMRNLLVYAMLSAGTMIPPAPAGERFPPLTGATPCLNSQPLTPAGLTGKVVLVEFWTYTCINWRRTLPYVRAWAERYKDAGLVVIGVSTPEFTFEHQEDNVRWAIRDMQMDFPVCMDNNYTIWN